MSSTDRAAQGVIPTIIEGTERRHVRRDPHGLNVTRTSSPPEHHGATSRISRSIAGAIVALVVVASFVFIFKVSGKMPDFEVFWRAGERAAAAEPLYRVADGHYQF